MEFSEFAREKVTEPMGLSGSTSFVNVVQGFLGSKNDSLRKGMEGALVGTVGEEEKVAPLGLVGSAIRP